jgi:hypothetical protein
MRLKKLGIAVNSHTNLGLNHLIGCMVRVVLSVVSYRPMWLARAVEPPRRIR